MFSWLFDLTSRERRTMLACFGGWSLDALDVQIFSFVIPSLLALWKITAGEAGELGTITLLVSAFGGWLAGALSDRWGRVRVLQFTILWYAVFTFLCGFAQDFNQLFIFRALAGPGLRRRMGGRRGADGRSDPGRYRGRAVGLVQTGWSIGWGAAAMPVHYADCSAAGRICLAQLVLDRAGPRGAGVLDPPVCEEPEIRRNRGGAGGVMAHILGAETAVPDPPRGVLP